MLSSTLYTETPNYWEKLFIDGEHIANIKSYQHVDLTAEKRYLFELIKTQHTLDGFYTVGECKDALFSRFIGGAAIQQ